MSLSRRDFLRLSALMSAAAGACSPLYQRASGLLGPVTAPRTLRMKTQQVLGRAAFGPSAVEVDRIQQIGLGAWLEEQLSAEGPPEEPVQILMRQLDVIDMDSADLEGWEKGDVLRQLRAGTLLRRVYGRRQLYERMVEFWTDHFNIYVEKGDCWMLKVVDDREVIRAQALGQFEDLLLASARSPAMLIYLDNQANEASAPNENYAREVMELHTLGVDGGYSQRDVMELARCLTGWTVKGHFWKGEFVFKLELHDKGVKRVMGQRIEPAGEREAERVLRSLAGHESTAAYISEKLVRRFVTDRPLEQAPDLVERVARTFRDTDGDLRRVARTLFLDGLLQREAPLPPKFKRPVDLGGWDTHFAQGGSEGLMASLLQDLGEGLAAFHTDMADHLAELTVVVMSEFGRRANENASLGTDHGHGGAMLLLGGSIRGGRVHGTWPGLAEGQLFGPGDLAVTTDYRDVLGELLERRLNNPALEHIFPGYEVAPLDLAAPRSDGAEPSRES